MFLAQFLIFCFLCLDNSSTSRGPSVPRPAIKNSQTAAVHWFVSAYEPATLCNLKPLPLVMQTFPGQQQQQHHTRMCSTADDRNGTRESLDPHAWAVTNGSSGVPEAPPIGGGVVPLASPAYGSFAIQPVGPPPVEKRCPSSQGTPIPVTRKLRKSCDLCCQRKRKCDGDGLSSCRFVTYRFLSLRGARYFLREGGHERG